MTAGGLRLIIPGRQRVRACRGPMTGSARARNPSDLTFTAEMDSGLAALRRPGM